MYRSDFHDTTYLGDYFNYDNPLDPENSYSLSLLVTSNPVHKEETSNLAIKSTIAYLNQINTELLRQTAEDTIGFDEINKPSG